MQRKYRIVWKLPEIQPKKEKYLIRKIFEICWAMIPIREIYVWNLGLFYFWTKQRNIKYWLHFILHTISKSTVTQNYAHVREGLLWAFKLCSNSAKLNCRENSYADFYVTFVLTHTHIQTHIFTLIFLVCQKNVP